MSMMKGLTEDGWSDVFLKRFKKTNLLKNLWNKDILNEIQDCFRARLVPLNKVWPDIP